MPSLSQIDFATISSDGRVWVGGDLQRRRDLVFKAWSTSIVVVQEQEVVPCAGLGGPNQGAWWGHGDAGLLKAGVDATILVSIARAYLSEDDPHQPPVTEVFTWTQTRELESGEPPEDVTPR